MNDLWKFHQCGDFCWDVRLSSTGHPHPFRQTTFLIYIGKLVAPSSSTYISRLSPSTAVSAFPWSANFFYNPFTLRSKFTSCATTSCFVSAFSLLLANSLFQWVVFVKCHVILSLDNKEATQPTVCCLDVNWVTHVHWPIKWQILKEVTWLITNH